KIDTLLMTDVCGLFAAEGAVQGVLLACKHGLFSVKCQQFVDASEHTLFTRRLMGQDPLPKAATFVLEVWKVKSPAKKTVSVPASLGIAGNEITVHRGKHASHQAFLEFRFETSGLGMDTVEHRAREVAVALGKVLPSIDPMFTDAEITQFAWEAQVTLQDETVLQPKLGGHYATRSTHTPSDCAQLLEIKEAAAAMMGTMETKAISPAPFAELMMVGNTISARQVTVADVDEPGLAIPLKRCVLDTGAIGRRKDCQVFVAGGGTAGAMAAIGASSKGADTIVADFFQDLGGTKTMCGVMGYYHGYRSHPFFKQQDDEANRLAVEANMSKRLGR